MVHSQTKSLPAAVIPVVDLTPLREQTNAASVGSALRSVTQGQGFVYLKGHGIPVDVIVDLKESFLWGEQNFFLCTCTRPLSRASFVYDPPQTTEDNQQRFGVAPHTDFGVLTVLCQHSTGGLQVQDLSGDWLHAPLIEGSLVVKVGGLMSGWTAGSSRSTPHRVVTSSGRERLSLVLAFDPDSETAIDAREIYGTDSPQNCLEASITCGDYLLWRFTEAFSYGNQSTGD